MKKSILIFADYFLPGFRAGGPVQSLKNLCEVLCDDYELYCVTRNHDFGQAECYSVELNAPIKLDCGATVFYQNSSMNSLRAILSIIKTIKPDYVYLNSFFSFRYSFMPLLFLRWIGFNRNQIVLAPRGELTHGAMHLKPWKKKCFLACVKWFSLHQGIQWHATSDAEKKELADFFPNAQSIHVIPNLMRRNTEQSIQPIEKKPGELKLIFLSRISRKKNLKFALEVLNNIVQTNITLDIYGPIEDSQYWHECESIIQVLPKNINARYCGVVEPDNVPITFAQHHAFLFPTLNENFGHVILEALNAGCMVVTTPSVPWNDLEQYGCGFNLCLDQNNVWKEKIEKIIGFNQEAFIQFCHSAAGYSDHKALFGKAHSAYYQLFQ